MAGLRRLVDQFAAWAADVLILALIRRGNDRAVVISARDYEDYVETAEILKDDETMDAIRQGERDLRSGDVEPYEDVRRDLGLAP
jgi:PHD/YefM family antitoxin component YafN of YafNO toxin-antitoxin module